MSKILNLGILAFMSAFSLGVVAAPIIKPVSDVSKLSIPFESKAQFTYNSTKFFIGDKLKNNHPWERRVFMQSKTGKFVQSSSFAGRLEGTWQLVDDERTPLSMEFRTGHVVLGGTTPVAVQYIHEKDGTWIISAFQRLGTASKFSLTSATEGTYVDIQATGNISGKIIKQ